MSIEENDEDLSTKMTISDEQPTTLLEQAETDSSYHSLECDQETKYLSKEDELMLPTTIDSAENDDERLRYRDMSFASSSNSFWRYKPSPKGPFVKKYKFSAVQQVNGHKPLTFIDPALETVHNGNSAMLANKYRVGEGNDITPDLPKLAKLGKEISNVQHDIATINGREKGKQKTKRKLISRQCRLKRSANHEANKIIFHGLEKEREELSRTIRLTKRRLESQDTGESLTDYCEKLKLDHTTTVAGEAEKYVNDQLKKLNNQATSNGDVGSSSDNDSDIDSGDGDSAFDSD